MTQFPGHATSNLPDGSPHESNGASQPDDSDRPNDDVAGRAIMLLMSVPILPHAGRSSSSTTTDYPFVCFLVLDFVVRI
jgi:hypothetical protein